MRAVWYADVCHDHQSAAACVVPAVGGHLRLQHRSCRRSAQFADTASAFGV